MKTCTEADCGTAVYSRGLCHRHYRRALYHGHITAKPRVAPGTTCAREGCERPHHALGLCHPCWRRKAQAETTLVCTIAGCEKVRRIGNRAGYCEMHNARVERVGTPDGVRPAGRSLAERWARYVPTGLATDVCWEWTGSLNNHGYGRLGHAYAHRISYEIHHGPIADGLHVMHSCDNPPCCNPAHLSLGTASDNMRDAVQKGRLIPPRGRS